MVHVRCNTIKNIAACAVAIISLIPYGVVCATHTAGGSVSILLRYHFVAGQQFTYRFRSVDQGLSLVPTRPNMPPTNNQQGLGINQVTGQLTESVVRVSAEGDATVVKKTTEISITSEAPPQTDET